MKFGYLFANAGPFADPELFAHLATTAEDVGIESLWTVEHVVVPVGYESTYPYDPSGRMPGPENSPIFDPILPLTYAAAITSKIKLATGVVILPQRHPFYIAKEAATLDVLSGGRAILGIGVGWLEEEFDALGIPFQTRASRTRETVEAMRQLWSPGAKSFEGKHFQWGEVESNPKPVQEGGVPIVVGGHTEIAAKRAARYGDGFFPAMVSEEQLASLRLVQLVAVTRPFDVTTRPVDVGETGGQQVDWSRIVVGRLYRPEQRTVRGAPTADDRSSRPTGPLAKCATDHRFTGPAVAVRRRRGRRGARSNRTMRHRPPPPPRRTEPVTARRRLPTTPRTTRRQRASGHRRGGQAGLAGLPSIERS